MNKEKTELLQQKLTRAILTLEELEAAIAANNHRVIGAKLNELRHELEAARSEVKP